MKILLVDDSETGYLVRPTLHPYHVDQAITVAQARALLAAEHYQLIMIDVSLPDGDGFSFCDRLVKEVQFESVPKLFCPRIHRLLKRVYGLNCGADDYITKPFESAELKARVDSRLRRLKHEGSIRLGGFELDPDFQRCTYAG